MQKLSTETKWLLENIEENIDVAEEDRLNNEWISFWNGTLNEGYFLPKRNAKDMAEVKAKMRHVLVNEALDDFDKMLYQQLEGVVHLMSSDIGKVLSVRPNYGTPTLASYFPIEIVKMIDAQDCLPANYPVRGGIETISKIIDNNSIDIFSHDCFGKKALEMGHIMTEIFSKYDKTAKYIHIYHPDTQGPMDLAEIIWGSGIFIDSYEEKDLLHALLRLITDTYIKYMDYWLDNIHQFDDKHSVHWGMIHRGRIFLRNDSAMNFSPEMYNEFFMPYDSELSNRYGSCMHFCGKGDHYIPMATTIEKLYAINLSQPELNDMETLFRSSVDRGVYILDLDRNCTVLSDSRRSLRGCVSCQ